MRAPALLAPLLLAALPATASEHALHQAHAESGRFAVPTPAPVDRLPNPRPPRGPHTVQVYGYLAYWADDLDTLRWDALTHLALFTAHAEPDGTLTDQGRWGDIEGALARAAEHDVRVHLTVANFDREELRALLGSAAARGRLIDALDEAVERTGVDGVNVDFENVPGDRRAELVTFTRDLAARVPEVVLATPAVDWTDAWDYAALTDHADLFIMGYGYHWRGSSNAGPVDPLYGGGPWNRWSLDWTVGDYLDKGADPDRVILGLPLYGYAWPTASDAVPAPALERAEVVFWTDGADRIQAHGRRFEDSSRTPWTWDGQTQSWFSDAGSVRERLVYATDAGLGGVGFWALNYDGDDPSLWEAVLDETTAPAPEDTGDGDTGGSDDDDGAGGDDADGPAGDPRWQADAGDPFLAYVGETVQLSAEWSSGPAEPVYRWTQVDGPPVTLSAPSAVAPTFRIGQPGTHTFQVTVGDGEAESAPARSYVIAVERDLGPGGCGCATGPAGALPALWLPLLALLRRRR
jgi:MYXO-CTERM domain-containing protein